MRISSGILKNFLNPSSFSAFTSARVHIVRPAEMIGIFLRHYVAKEVDKHERETEESSVRLSIQKECGNVYVGCRLLSALVYAYVCVDVVEKNIFVLFSASYSLPIWTSTSVQ